MNCPYPDCNQKTLPAGAVSCPTCGRVLKACPQCGVSSRAFANFCRSCGQALPESTTDWSSFKGSPQRLGLNRAPPIRPFGQLEIREVTELQLGDRCRSLLSYDRHLIAISQSGVIEIVDVGGRRLDQKVRLIVDGPISCEACVSSGTLYLGAPGRIAAYPLAGLTLPKPRLEPLWDVPVSGTPVCGLLAFENRLYLNVAHPDGLREIQIVDDIGRDKPGEARVVYAGRRLGWLAANPPSRRVFFLSEENGALAVHSADHAASSRPEVVSMPIPRAPRPFADHVPIAVMGAKLFAVLGEEDKLCRIDAHDGVFDLVVREDIKSFSLSGIRDGVLVATAGLVFPSFNLVEPLNPMERVKLSPVILKDCAAVVGMQGGRIRVYDLQNPPVHQDLRLSNDPLEEVTALASFRSYIAAGSLKGTVKVFELV